MKTTVIALLGGMPFFGAVLFLNAVAFSRLPQTSGSLEQPISFSHKMHAGDYQIGCLHCRANARRSTVAGIPSVFQAGPEKSSHVSHLVTDPYSL